MSPLIQTAIPGNTPVVTTQAVMPMARTFRCRADLLMTIRRSVTQTLRTRVVDCRKMALLSQYGGMIKPGNEENATGTTVMSTGSAVSKGSGYGRVWPPPFVTCSTGPPLNRPRNKSRT